MSEINRPAGNPGNPESERPLPIRFVPVDRSNYMDCINLRIDEAQKRFVAPNAFSLAQAAYEPNMYPLAIYAGEAMVGFILYDFDDELEAWSMSRLMIDRSHQGKGLGKRSVRDFVAYFFQTHAVSQLYTSVEVENPVAISLYEQLGFARREIFEYDAGGEHYKEIRMLLDRKDFEMPVGSSGK